MPARAASCLGSSPLGVIRSPHLGEVHHVSADGNRDALGSWLQFCQHVTGVVAQPLGLLAFALGRERDRAVLGGNEDDEVFEGGDPSGGCGG
jgi:hypothetical protein